MRYSLRLRPSPRSSRFRCLRLLLTALGAIFLSATAGAQEIGINDLRITNLGPDGNPQWDASEVAVAYNPEDDVYLVAFQGDTLGAPDNTPEGDATEIFVRPLAGSGAPLGPAVAISQSGPPGDARFDAALPDVAYNATAGQFLVVWQSDHEGDNAFEIYGQRLDGATGGEIGQDFVISSTGPAGNADFDAIHGRVAWSAQSNRYLVVFQAGGTVVGNRDHEIFAQRLGGNAAPIGAPIAISGPDSDSDRDGLHPDVAYSSAGNLFAVVWEGEVDANESQIFCELRHAVTGDLIGADNRQVSDQGPGGVNHFDADDPAVAFSAASGRLLVAWDGDASVGPGPGGVNDDEEEIFVRLLEASSGIPSSPTVRASTTGPDGNAAFDAVNPKVAWNAEGRVFLVVWAGEDQADGEVEIHGQEIDDQSGAPAGPDDFRISDMGPDGQPAFGALAPALAYSSVLGELLAVWEGDDAVDGELEIYGQFLGSGPLQPCSPTPTRLCLRDGLFAVEVSWKTKTGKTGLGQAVPLNDDTGYFWFFNDTNVELVLKALDGRTVNGRWWIFYGALSDVEYTITVTNTFTGKGKLYFNPQSNLASVADTSAFPNGGEPVTGAATRAPSTDAPAATARANCQADGTTLCLAFQQFEVEVAWKNPKGATGVGMAVPLTNDTGWFWFFNDTNVELMIKVLDGRLINGWWWVFYGALSDVEYTITVTNRATGAVKTYFNPQKNLASVADTTAFPG